ncbi:hypothetical protein IAU60_003904 [Kwoniella sp. DSM 27419]
MDPQGPYPPDDPFGFEHMHNQLRSQAPEPWVPSTQGTPAPPASPSPTIFSRTASVTSQASVEDVSSALRRPTPPHGHSQVQGRWRGANILRRMDGEAAPLRSNVLYKGPATKHAGSTGKKRTMSAVVSTLVGEPEPLSEVSAARQARILHYADLEANYQLHVEYVLF